MTHLEYLKTNTLSKPYEFNQVIASYDDHKGNRGQLGILGNCYSKYSSSPALFELTNAIAEILPSEIGTVWVGIVSCNQTNFIYPNIGGSK